MSKIADRTNLQPRPGRSIAEMGGHAHVQPMPHFTPEVTSPEEYVAPISATDLVSAGEPTDPSLRHAYDVVKEAMDTPTLRPMASKPTVLEHAEAGRERVTKVARSVGEHAFLGAKGVVTPRKRQPAINHDSPKIDQYPETVRRPVTRSWDDNPVSLKA